MALNTRRKAPAKKAGAGGRDTRSRLHAVASRFGAWRPATEVLTRVRAVQTCLPAVDMATRVNGWPLERFTLVSGPSGDGKTYLVHGIGLSFLQGDHFYGLMDAERTTPVTWLETMMPGMTTHPGFVALRPDTYEDAVDAARRFCLGIAEARDKKQIPPETTGVLVVDSIRKLTPAGMLEKLQKEFNDKGGIDGASGRAGQIKAALNAAWVDELIPLLHNTGTAMVVIARETYEQAGRFTRRKIGGGKALYYEASIEARVTADVVKDASGHVVGERHMVKVGKTKVSSVEETGWFNTRTAEHPRGPGFWPARDVFELAMRLGVVVKRTRKKTTCWVVDDGEVLSGSTEHEVIDVLEDEPERMAELEALCRTRFKVEG